MVMVRCLPSMLEALSSIFSVVDKFQSQEKRPLLQQKHLDEANFALDQEGVLRGVIQKQELHVVFMRKQAVPVISSLAGVWARSLI